MRTVEGKKSLQFIHQSASQPEPAALTAAHCLSFNDARAGDTGCKDTHDRKSQLSCACAANTVYVEAIQELLWTETCNAWVHAEVLAG